MMSLLGVMVMMSLMTGGRGFLVSAVSLTAMLLAQAPLWGSDSMGASTSSTGLFMWSLLVMTLVVFSLCYPLFWEAKAPSNLNMLMLALLFTLGGFFSSSGLLEFYVFFELSLVPMFMIIMGWGYQPERLKAGFMFFFYTMTASLPLFISLLIVFENSNTLSIGEIWMWSGSSGGSAPGGSWGLTLATSAAFLVKLPIFFLHLWLPQAHVEAPVFGSMVLAAVLLKLGGVGLVRLAPLLNESALKFIAFWGLFGGTYISVVCLYQIDLKVVIAYASVSHMGMVIYLATSGLEMGIVVSIMVMLTHGISSSCFFLMSYMMSSNTNSRSLLVGNNFLSAQPSISLLIFLVVMSNMASPPSLNLLVELMSLIAITEMTYSSWGAMIIFMLAAMAYTLLVYTSFSHGSSSSLFSQQTPPSAHLPLLVIFHLVTIFLGMFFMKKFS